MSTSLDQISLLAQLSKVDGDLDQLEINMIHYIGKLHGFTIEQIDNIIDKPTKVGDLSSLDDDLRFEYLFNLVQLMKIDGRVTNSEIDYCEKLAVRLGYRAGVIAELSTYIYKDPEITTNKETLKKLASDHRSSRKK
jgi:uncharacterized tellurite resistance protein B-like protein